MAVKPKGETLTLDGIQKILGNIPLRKLNETEKFLKGDHWQGALGWVGWLPKETAPTYAEDMLAISKSFTSKNVIRGMVKRLIGAVFGKEPDWDVVADAENSSSDDSESASDSTTNEIDSVLLDWWEDKQVHEVLKKFILNKASYGKACLRLYIPSGFIDTNGTAFGKIDVSDWKEALDLIHIDCPSYTKVNNEPDLNYGSDVVVIETSTDDAFAEKVYEVYYKTEDGFAAVRQIREAMSTEKQSNDAILTLDLEGNQLVFVAGEFDEALITDSIKSQQKQVNHAKTMEGFALRNINFPETVFLNASMETEEKTDATTGKTTTTLKDIIRGAGRWLNLIGVTTMKPDGSESLVPADVKWRQPADPEKFAKVAENNAKDMHEEAGMLYVFLADNPYPSGESRIEAMTDYLILLVDMKTLADKVGHWLLETAYYFANSLANSTPSEVDFLFSTKLTLGRTSTQDKQVMLQEVQQKLRSRRNYMIAAEVSDDPTSEEEAIREDMDTMEELMPPMPTAQAVLTGTNFDSTGRRSTASSALTTTATSPRRNNNGG